VVQVDDFRLLSVGQGNTDQFGHDFDPFVRGDPFVASDAFLFTPWSPRGQTGG
jgi:hypothetical protein